MLLIPLSVGPASGWDESLLELAVVDFSSPFNINLACAETRNHARLGSFIMAPDISEAWDETDDWTGVTSAAERRRRQSRLHQRAYRESLDEPIPRWWTVTR